MSNRASFKEFLHRYQGDSVYDGLDADAVPVDNQGFQSPDNVRFFKDVFRVFRPECMIEFGSWKGSSAIMFVKQMQTYSETPMIACIDTWLGSLEHWSTTQGRAQLGLRHGRPSLYDCFLANVVRAGVARNVVPFPMTTKTAIEMAKRAHVKVDAVYVDASHEYAEVLDDLRGAWELIDAGGVVIADDYNAAGVRQALLKFCAQPGVFGLFNADVPWPEAILVKTEAMRDRAAAAHPSLAAIPKPPT